MFSKDFKENNIKTRKILYSQDEYIEQRYIFFFLVRGKIAIRTQMSEEVIEKILSHDSSVGDITSELETINVKIETNSRYCDKFFCSSKSIYVEDSVSGDNIHDEILNFMLQNKRKRISFDAFIEKQNQISKKINLIYNKIKG